MLQGRYGVSGWRRQIRLQAYTEFLNAAHDFNNLLDDAIKNVNESNLDEKRQALREAHVRIRRAATLVGIAGPRSIDGSERSVIGNMWEIMADIENGNSFITAARAHMKGKSYPADEAWKDSLRGFEKTVRRILKTTG